MVDLAHRSGDRQQDMKSEKRRAQMQVTDASVGDGVLCKIWQKKIYGIPITSFSNLVTETQNQEPTDQSFFDFFLCLLMLYLLPFAKRWPELNSNV